MYVARSYNLHTLPVWKRIFLPVLYSTGLVDSSKKRKITSISVTLAVAVLVIISKRLSPLPRGVLDVGVVTGLGGGIVSLWYHFFVYARTGGIGLEGWGREMEGYPVE